MADNALYETDILAWSEQQAGALRELAARRDLPNALDLEHVLEEIADVGLSELNAIKSFVRLIPRHAVKCVVDPEALTVRHWHVEINNWQCELADRISRSMHQRIDMGMLWGRAVRQAELDLLEQARDAAFIARLRSLHGNTCLLSLAELLLDPANPAVLVQRLSSALGA